MYSEDQDEDVEEEEEFHEVEEEKHKTSQESVESSGEQRLDQSTTSISKSSTAPEDNHKKLEESEQGICNDTPREEKNKPEGIVSEDCVVEEQKDAAPITQEREPSQDEPKSVEEPSKDEDTRAETDTGNSVVSTETSNCTEAKAAEPPSEPKPVIDWANIMLNKTKNDSDSAEESSSSDKVVSDNGGNPQSIIVAHDEDTIDGIIQDTQEKLKITDDSNSTLDSTTKALPDRDTTSSSNVDGLVSASGVSGDVDQVPHKVETSAPAIDELVLPEQGEAKGEQDTATEVEKKELDLDEDVKNPQYIPKKGVFYEHDDRSQDADEKKSSPAATQKEDETVEVRDTNANKKASGGEKSAENRRTTRRQRTDADRWAHDMFRNEKQKPKSKSELINAYGYDIRQERGSRNPAENRAPRTSSNNGNNSNIDRASGNQDVQRSRQSKDSRGPRQIQTSANNGSRERRPRRQNAKSNRSENSHGPSNRRDGQANRPAKVDNIKDLRETLDEKHAAQAAAAATARRDRDRDGSASNRNVRNDSRGRRRTSRDRPNIEDARLPPPNNVMPPITTWSSEDMMIAEAFGKKSPSHVETDENSPSNNSNNANSQRDRPLDGWEQGTVNKPIYQDRSIRSQDESRQNYNSRGRGDESHRQSQFTPRNQYHDRANQQHEWHRASNFTPNAKSSDYVVKTQTFENSRLSQANHNRSNNNRDLRDVINERRGNTQQNFQNKVQHSLEQHVNHRGHVSGHYHHQYTPTQHYMHPNHQQMVPGQSILPHQTHQQLAMTQSQLQQPQRSQQQSPQQIQAVPNRPQQHQQQQQNSHAQQSRQPPTTQPGQPVAGQSRQGITENSSESIRLNATTSSDPLNSRPIVKTDAYTGAGLTGHQQHSQPLSQHSQNHRSIGGPMPQSGAVTAGSHLVPSHLSAAATQPQYYQPSSGTRDPTAAAAMASAYHGYIPSGHPVMDPSRYHMTSQQLSDHGYITPSQTGDVAAGTVLHQQGLYTDTSGAGAMANTAYLAQAGSSLSPTTNIPVTGAGSQPLAPVSYIQHSQYPPPPYSNPYPQPQMNQPPPQSGHAYSYWTYI